MKFLQVVIFGLPNQAYPLLVQKLMLERNQMYKKHK